MSHILRWCFLGIFVILPKKSTYGRFCRRIYRLHLLSSTVTA